MGRMVPDATCQVHDDGDARAGPDLAAKAVAFGTPVQERGQAGQLVGRQAAGTPGGERGWRAAGPGSRARVIHWLTAASLTPMASAIWRWDQPRCRSSQAWRRRASFQL
jgi:hypothetical protein